MGEGAFAKVAMVRNLNSGKLYAMKVIHKNKLMIKEGEEFDS